MSLPRVPVSVGELLDKITILEIKSERIKDAGKLENIKRELKLLRDVWGKSKPGDTDLAPQIVQLKGVNETLWDIENRIRAKEGREDFDQGFIELARAVYFSNDKRANIKREINLAVGSDLVEEKSYEAY